MKNRFLIVVFLLIRLNIFAQTHKEIAVKINPNMETYAIVERLALPYSKYLKYRDSLLKVEKIVRPMAYYAHEAFKNQDNSKIAKHFAAVFDAIIDSKGIYPDAIYEALIFREDFPKKGKKALFKIDNPNVNTETKTYIYKEITSLVDEIRQFYIDRNVSSFMEKYKYFYDGAINEVKKAIPTNILASTADYYRNYDKNLYTVYLVPSRAFAKGEWQANGPVIPLKNGKKNYVEILNCAYDEVPVDSSGAYNKFGYSDVEFLTQLTIHEFGHSFVSWGTKEIETTKSNTVIFSGEWENEMKKYGVWSWETCVNEHIVRTVEIRIAEKMGNKERADLLRGNYIKKRKYLIIPQLEMKLLEYEDSQQKYPSFKSFLPELIKICNSLTIEERDKLLSATR